MSLNRTDPSWSLFSLFRERFHRRYDNLQELETRFSIFKNNLMHIHTHNAMNHTFNMSVNQFADFTLAEFKERVGTINLKTYGCKPFTFSLSELPESIDWREKGAVTTVKDQGQCGSCWTFSATGAIEGAWAIQTGELVDLSEQELVDCAGVKYGSHGCNGGQMDGAFEYVIKNGQCGANYSYTGKSGACQKCLAIAAVSSCYDVLANDQVALKAAVAQQPVSVAIEADTNYFQFYSGGVLAGVECGTNLDHGVLIVGYGTENNQDYWLVKNSWSTSWGEDGYIKIGRSDSKNDKGVCGIAMEASFPI
jgi:C1A family cysteine protease